MNPVTGGKPNPIEECSDISVGKKVHLYLEGKLTDDAEISEFVDHAAECPFCMKTIVRWHYDAVVAERRSNETQAHPMKAISATSKHDQAWSATAAPRIRLNKQVH